MSQVQLQLSHSITVLHNQPQTSHTNQSTNLLAPPSLLLTHQMSTDSSDSDDFEGGLVDESPRQTN